MPIAPLRDIVSERPAGRRLAGLDIGTKTIGVALSDPLHSIATPLRLIERTKFTADIRLLDAVIKEYAVAGFVLGYPLNMDGSEGPRCQAVRHFAQEMARHPEIFGPDPWIALWDERLSTAAVDRFMIEEVDMSRTKRKQNVDKLAAQFILQGALDFIQAMG